MATQLLPSSSLIRAATGENQRIERALASLRAREHDLGRQLDELREAIRSLLDRQELLAQLTHGNQGVVEAAAARPGRLVKGRELRREAGRLLWTTVGDGQIHYREWYERMLVAGVVVGGKDPLASFLTNVRDSPAVARGSRPGYYRLDRATEDAGHRALGEAVAELRDVSARLEAVRQSGASAAEADRLRNHRDRMTRRVRALEADLAELHAIFASGDSRYRAAA
jgi:hypothetical protein